MKCLSTLHSCSVEVLSGGVVRVHLSTKLCSHANTALHNFVSLIVGNVQLEEARMSLRESLIIHASIESYLVLVVEVLKVDWKTAATPNKLEVG